MSDLEGGGDLHELGSGSKFLLGSPQLVPEVSPRWPQACSFECVGLKLLLGSPTAFPGSQPQMATGVFFRVCGLDDSFAGCVLGFEHQFHMGTHLCETAWGGTYGREVGSGQFSGGKLMVWLPSLQLP